MFKFLMLFLVNFDIGISRQYPFQLPEDVKPIEYDLSVFPNLALGTYQGTVKITVRVTKKVHSVTLHSKNLSIIEARIDSKKVLYSTNIIYDFLILHGSNSISKGIHTVSIKFSGDMKHKTYGFFRGYEEVNGKKVYFGATFFEPVNARVAFPCFDEPTLKARFLIHITKPSDHEALSNMNVVKETKYGNNHYTTVHFAKTPLMSPYLVEMFIGKYGFREAKYRKFNGEVIPLRMYSPPEKLNNTEFPVKEMPKILKWYANYTGFDYMLPKLDYITLNRKFHIEGGMENWGAVTTREDSVFYNNRMSTLWKRNALNMGHEFSHFWFGDLLTTSSWGQFWLNEGFATFMDMKSSSIYPEHDNMDSSIFNTKQNSLWVDDETSINPLSWTVKKPSDAYNILNSINYAKGGSVLKMVEDLIGDDTMQRVLQTYIRKYQYQNVDTQDFLDTLQEFVSFNATDFLNGFIKQSGYPLVSVSQISRNKVSIRKTRFIRMDQAYKEGRWTLPIKYITNLNSHTPQLVWFPGNINKLIIKLPKGVKWIKLNAKQGGYYRTNYPEKMWQTISTIIKGFHIRDKMHLLDESFALVRANKLKCGVAFNLTTYLYDEDRYETWVAVQHGFRQIRTGLTQNNMSVSSLEKYVSQLVDGQFRRNKWTVDETESFRTKTTRQTIFNLACTYSHPQCVKKVQELWPKRKLLPVDIYDIVMTNYPTRNTTSKFHWGNTPVEDSTWFGADLSVLKVGSEFKWPKSILKECNAWLEYKLK